MGIWYYSFTENSMKKLLLLSGNDVSNELWIDRIAEKFSGAYEVHVHRYTHWRTGEQYINLESELKILQEEIRGWEDYFIFAKSAGTILTMKGVHEKTLAPQKAVFVGCPFPWGRERGFQVDQYLSDFSTSTRFIQQENDFLLSAAALKSELETSAIDKPDIITIPGDSHEYEDIDLVIKHAQNFFQEPDDKTL